MSEYLDCTQAAERARCSMFRIREAIKSGELNAYKPGKAYVIDVADLDNWIKRCKVKKVKQ